MPDAGESIHSAQTIAAPARPAPIRLELGTTLVGRYRVVTLLGRGGMGEVYRADDLTLGVPVALKFLPVAVAGDPVRLDRFRGEVRVARQVSHANVCRVYDISEADAGVFLSMEFVDGEDLASLLRRIGRLPHDKAVQVARQLCFGLAAAHEQGVIHRDLKPANIMIDGRGNARIMDFGIAALAGAADGDRAGTPGYMSPEQERGEPATRRSDLYSLGLVLFELFTGKPAIDMTAAARSAGVPAGTAPRPSQVLPDIDPVVERVIVRCLEEDVAARPSSAIAVAAALPGGDPLAAALAAGETPSPELIAASGPSGTMSPVEAWGRAAVIAALLGAMLVLTSSWSLVSRVKPEKSVPVLRDRAAEIARALGYTDPPPVDTAHGLGPRFEFISATNRDESVKDKAARLAGRPGAYEFWYRESPAPITPEPDGMVRQTAPFPSRPGEVLIRTDAWGRLEFFSVIPARRRGESASAWPETMMPRVFELAGLEAARFSEAEPINRPFVSTEAVRSWTGSLAEYPELPVRVHMGAVEGRINYAAVTYTWSTPAVPEQAAAAGGGGFVRLIGGVLEQGAGAVMFVALAGAGLVAWRNLRSGRGDRTSAARVGLAMFVFTMVSMLLVAHRLPPIRALFFNGTGVAPALFSAAQAWVFYVALEPFARRVYPQALVSWTRVLRGSVLDPTVARHVLLGMLVGGVSVLATAIFATAVREFVWGSPMISLYGRSGAYCGGTAAVASASVGAFGAALMIGAGSMLPLVTGELVFKRRWAGYLALVVVLAAIQAPTLSSNALEGVASIAVALIPVVAIRAGGLLALVVTHVTIMLGQMLPVGFDWSHGLTAPAWIPVLVLAGMAGLAAHAASAGSTFGEFPGARA